jgi:hypothetical protein
MQTSMKSFSLNLFTILRPVCAALFLLATVLGFNAATAQPKPDDPNAITIVINSADGAPSMDNPLLLSDKVSGSGALGIRINGHVCGHHKAGDEEIWSPCLWKRGVCVCGGR